MSNYFNVRIGKKVISIYDGDMLLRDTCEQFPLYSKAEIFVVGCITLLKENKKGSEALKELEKQNNSRKEDYKLKRYYREGHNYSNYIHRLIGNLAGQTSIKTVKRQILLTSKVRKENDPDHKKQWEALSRISLKRLTTLRTKIKELMLFVNLSTLQKLEFKEIEILHKNKIEIRNRKIIDIRKEEVASVLIKKPKNDPNLIETTKDLNKKE